MHENTQHNTHTHTRSYIEQLLCMYNIFAVLPLCQFLDDIDNGRVNCSLGEDGVPNEGDTCIYVCDEGFYVTGNTIVRECQSDGNWSGNEPTCERGNIVMHSN